MKQLTRQTRGSFNRCVKAAFFGGEICRSVVLLCFTDELGGL